MEESVHAPNVFIFGRRHYYAHVKDVHIGQTNRRAERGLRYWILEVAFFAEGFGEGWFEYL